MLGTILICDDNKEISNVISSQLQALGYAVKLAKSGDELIAILNKPHDISLILLDLIMPDLDGLGVLNTLRKSLTSSPPVVAYMREGASDLKGSAFNAGARDVLNYPFDTIDLKNTLKTQLELYSMLNQIHGSVMQVSHKVTALYRLADKFAFTNHPILIEGARGTQKSNYIHYIMQNSDRVGRSFFTIECGEFYLTKTDLQEKFHLAQNSFLILKNIEKLAKDLQETLMSLISDVELKKKTRIIATTNICLLDLAKQNLFREDLYYRLNLCSLKITPLRERKDDIQTLSMHYLRRYSIIEHKNIIGLDDSAIEFLKSRILNHNERELSSKIWRAVILCDADYISATHFKSGEKSLPHTMNAPSLVPQIQHSQDEGFNLFESGNMRSFADIEQDIYREALIYYKGNLSEIARRLGVGRSTLYRKLAEYQLVDQVAA